jgi:hypothetical protein
VGVTENRKKKKENRKKKTAWSMEHCGRDDAVIIAEEK